MAETRKYSRSSKSSTPSRPVDEYGHLQPQALDFEEAVLGALMIEKDAYSVVSEILRPESFYERKHQLLYKAITTLAMRQQPVDILTVAEQLRKTGELEEAGGPFYITQLSGKHGDGSHEVGRELRRQEDGGRTVGTTDDSDTCCPSLSL